MIYWLHGKKLAKNQPEMDNSNINSSAVGELDDLLGGEGSLLGVDAPGAEKHRRYIVFSICLSDDLIIEDMYGMNI